MKKIPIILLSRRMETGTTIGNLSTAHGCLKIHGIDVPLGMGVSKTQTFMGTIGKILIEHIETGSSPIHFRIRGRLGMETKRGRTVDKESPNARAEYSESMIVVVSNIHFTFNEDFHK